MKSLHLQQDSVSAMMTKQGTTNIAGRLKWGIMQYILEKVWDKVVVDKMNVVYLDGKKVGKKQGMQLSFEY